MSSCEKKLLMLKMRKMAGENVRLLITLRETPDLREKHLMEKWVFGARGQITFWLLLS